MQQPAGMRSSRCALQCGQRSSSAGAARTGDTYGTTALHLQPVCNLGEDQHAGSHRLQVAPWHLQHSPCSACGQNATTMSDPHIGHCALVLNRCALEGSSQG